MRALIDLNVILDVLHGRPPFVAKSKAVLKRCANKRLHGFVCAASVDTLDYLKGT